MIPIYTPDITSYSSYAIDAIKSGWISSQGKYVKLLIDKLKTYFNIPYVVLNANGTTATHCLFLALKYKYPKIDTIYVPNNVYVAAWNAALMVYKSENLEVLDIDQNTWNMRTDDDYIMSLKPNSAVLIVHNIGNIVNVPRLKILRPDLIFLEDNCEGLFGKYDDIYSGMSECSLASCCSFFANKNITSGEGGAFFTHDKDVYDYIFSVCHQGMSDKRYIHNILAYNYRMTNIEAAFILEQLEHIDTILEKKQKVFKNFDKLLQDEIHTGKISKQRNEQETNPANWMYAIRINENKSYDELYNFLYNNGVDNRPLFYPINAHAHLRDIKINDDKTPIILNEQCVMLPSYPDLTFEQQQYIVDVIKKFLE